MNSYCNIRLLCKGQTPTVLDSLFPVNTSLKLHILDMKRKKECHNSLKGETQEMQRKRKGVEVGWGRRRK